MRVTAIDFETANASPASVCSVGISTMKEGKAEETYYTLIRPEKNVSFFSPFNMQIHGIHPEEVENAPVFSDVYRDLCDLFEDSIVCAHNARFDMTCLKQACLNTGRAVPDLRYFDTVALSRRVFPRMAHHRLNDMCDYLHIRLHHHNALSDSYGCLMIVERVMDMTGIYDIEKLLKKYGIHIHELKELK